MRRLLAVGVWAVGLCAAAQGVKPTVVAAPLELRRKPPAIAKDAEALGNEFDRLVRASGVRVPPPSEVTRVLSELKRQDFAASDEALAQLAQRAQTLYAIHVQMDYPITGTVVGLGKVVRADGKRMGDEVRLERSREMRTYPQATLEMLNAVLEKLDLQRLPSSLPVVAEPTPPVKPEPAVQPDAGVPPPPPPIVVYEKNSNLLMAGRIVTVGGAALALGGLVLLGVAGGDAGRLTPNAMKYLPEDQVGLYQGAKSKELAGGALLGIGGAVAVAGAAMWLMAGQEPSGQVMVAPIPGGAAASFSGNF